MARHPIFGGRFPLPGRLGEPGLQEPGVPPPSTPVRKGPFSRACFRVLIGEDEIALSHVSSLHWEEGEKTDPALRRRVTLRRAVGQDRTLFEWRRAAALGRGQPHTVTVILLDAPGGEPVSQWQLVDARPVRWSGPEFDAFSDGIAFEELDITYESIIW